MEHAFLKAVGARVVKILTEDREVPSSVIKSQNDPSDRFLHFPRKSFCTSFSITTCVDGVAMGSMDANDKVAVDKCVHAHAGAILAMCDVVSDKVTKHRHCYNDVIAVEIAFELVKFEDSDEYNCICADARIIYAPLEQSHLARLESAFMLAITEECNVNTTVVSEHHETYTTFKHVYPEHGNCVFAVDLELPIDPSAVIEYSDVDANTREMMGACQSVFAPSINDALKNTVAIIKTFVEAHRYDYPGAPVSRVVFHIRKSEGPHSIVFFRVHYRIGTDDKMV